MWVLDDYQTTVCASATAVAGSYCYVIMHLTWMHFIHCL